MESAALNSELEQRHFQDAEYSGATSVSGTLKLIGGASLATSSGIVVTGTFDLTGLTTGTSIKTLSGSGTVALGTKVLTLSAAADTFSGVISGTGGSNFILTGGTETLSGVNTYAGATTITSGTLVLSGAGSISASSSVTNNAVLDISGVTAASSTITSLAGTTVGATVTLGAKTLNLTAAADTYAGKITGSAAWGSPAVPRS